MDIDDILRAAETRDSDDHPHTIGEELLSQFKVWFMKRLPLKLMGFLSGRAVLTTSLSRQSFLRVSRVLLASSINNSTCWRKD